MDKPTLFLDCDDCVIQSTKAYCEVYNFLFKNHPLFVSADYTQNYDWNFAKVAPLAKDKTEAIFGSTYFFDLVKPFPNAVEVIQKLKEHYKIIMVSIGTHDNISLKSSWLADNFPMIDDFIGIVNKGVHMDKSIINMKPKNNEINNLFIDDNENNLFSQSEPNLIRYCYGVKKPWNEQWYKMNGRWLKDWLDIEERLIKKVSDDEAF